MHTLSWSSLLICCRCSRYYAVEVARRRMCELAFSIRDLPTACSWPSRAQILPATTRTKMVNQNVASIWDVFYLFWWWWWWWRRHQITKNYTPLWTNRKVKASFFCCYAASPSFIFLCNNCFKISSFEIFILNAWKIFAGQLSDLQKECKFLIPVLLIETWINSVSSLFPLLFLLKEDKARVQLSYSPQNYLGRRLPREVAADFKRGSVRQLD